MMKNFLLFFCRNKVYAATNIVGLAAGIASCIFIYLYVQREPSYVKHFSSYDGIYRVANDLIVEGNKKKASVTHAALVPTLAADFSEGKTSTCLIQREKQAGGLPENTINAEHIFFADSDYFQICDYKIPESDPKTALLAPSNLVLSIETASEFFDEPRDTLYSTSCMGSLSYKVTGVFEPSDAAPIKPNGLTFISTNPADVRQNSKSDWENTNSHANVLLRKANKVASLQDFVKRHRTPARGNTTERVELKLQALTGIYLNSGYPGEAFPIGRKSYSFFFSFVGGFILLNAVINYMNMTTARLVKRSKEIGVRKVLGAQRHQLMLQFLRESVFLTLFAVLLALLIVELMLPLFNRLTDQHIATTYYLDITFVFIITVIIFFIGVVAGCYPALVLSHVKPADILRNGKVRTGNGSMLHKGLVVLQCTISLILLMSTGIAYKQMRYLQNKGLDYTQNQVLVMHHIPGDDSTIVSKVPVIEAELFEPLVTMVSRQNNRYLMAHMSHRNVEDTIAYAQGAWTHHPPLPPSDYFIQDDSFDEQYRAAEKMLLMISYFAIVTFIISGMGLFGLAFYTAELRTKEIAIRKALGSSVSGIVMLLTKDFVPLLCMATLLACPIAWHGMNKWLQDFAYRTPVSAWFFILPGSVALVIAMLTVSLKATQAAMTDPVRALRTE